MTASNLAAAELRNVGVTYTSRSGPVQALKFVSHTFAPGTATAILGRSGSGKSTLISVLALMRRPTSGEVLIEDQPSKGLDDGQLAALRSMRIGIVFQSFHLDPASDAMSNVMLPWVFHGGMTRKAAKRRSVEVLERLGIADLANAVPREMSGGQRQRVAVARALFPRPALFIADEPTGNLDEETANLVAKEIFALADDGQTTVVVVTHDAAIGRLADVTLLLAQGKIVERK